MIGVCGGCGGELDKDAMTFALEAGPGPRGQGEANRYAVLRTRIDRFDVCSRCLNGPGGKLLWDMMDDAYNRALPGGPRRCTVECLRPRRRNLMLVTRRSEYENTYCPVCYGPADVHAAPDAAPVRLGIWNKLRGRTVARERWTA